MTDLNPQRPIVRDPRCCGGQPVIRGTRVTLNAILASLAEGDRPEEIVRAFPSICIEDVYAARSGEKESRFPSSRQEERMIERDASSKSAVSSRRVVAPN